jgi:serine/threonine protein kinase
MLQLLLRAHLMERLCAGRMPEPIAAFYFAQLLRAVQFMHDNGFCHRDIKPENCMVERHTNRLKLIDFGEPPHLCSGL